MNLRPRRRDLPRVELTPLIDVVFLLLIFFMVSTTFDKQTRLQVELPEAESVVTEEDKPDQIEIVIDADGRFFVNERELVRHDVETLRRTMEKIADGRRDLPVVVSGDRNAPYQSAMTVLDAAGQLGMAHLSFVAKQVAGEEP
jgi:biopolymer transport protein ExbD